MTTAVSATPPLVMKVFEPFRTQWSPSRTAVVVVPPASEPALFSVSPQQPDLLALGQGREVLLLLRLAAGEEDVAGAEAVVGGDREGHARVHPRQLLHDDRVVEGRRGPSPPYSAGQRDPHEAQLAELREDLARELLLLVPLARVGAKLRLGELADRLLEEPLLLAQAEVQERTSSDRGPRAAAETMIARLAGAVSAVEATNRLVASRMLLCVARSRSFACSDRWAWSWPTGSTSSGVFPRAPRSGPWRREPGQDRGHESSGRTRRGAPSAEGEGVPGLRPPLPRFPPPHQRRARGRGPEVLRPRRRRLGGDPGVHRERRREGALRPRGGSTITQQLAKNLFFTTRKSARRASCGSWSSPTGSRRISARAESSSSI